MSEHEQNERLKPGVEKSDAGVGNPDEYLGMIGGLGVGAAVHYYQELARAHSSAGVPLRMIMANADVDIAAGHVSRGEIIPLANYLLDLVRRLYAAGATFAVIPAVTPHICLPELARRSPLPLLDMLDLTAREVHARGIRRVALFGTRYVIQSRLFDRLHGIDVVLPQPDEIETIHDLYFSLVESGSESAEVRDRLIAIAGTLQERDGVEAIVLAGTDLALVFNENNTPFPAIDCAGIQIAEILKRLIPSR